MKRRPISGSRPCRRSPSRIRIPCLPSRRKGKVRRQLVSPVTGLPAHQREKYPSRGGRIDGAPGRCSLASAPKPSGLPWAVRPLPPLSGAPPRNHRRCFWWAGLFSRTTASCELHCLHRPASGRRAFRIDSTPSRTRPRLTTIDIVMTAGRQAIAGVCTY
jgi:hypothetical protein